MSWKCPECGKTNESRECPCGYAYYKILGTKSDDSRATVQQACDYLLKLWREKASSGDQVTRQRAAARLKQIQAAQDVFKQLAPAKAAGKTALPQQKVIIISAAAGVVLVILAVFLFTGRGKPKEQPAPAVQPAQPGGTQPAQPAPQEAQPQTQDQPSAVLPLPPPPPVQTDSSVEKTDQWAIDEVKKSHALEKFMTVDEVAKKWAEKRSTWRALGWQAKKMDTDIYLVSYLLSDGLNMDGMYFDINTSTGAIRHLANHPELQQKYGIHYKQ